METSDLIASAAVCDKARYPTNLHVTEQGLLLAMHGPNGAGIVSGKVIAWADIDGVEFPPCALVASSLVDLEDNVADLIAKGPMPDLTQTERIKAAHATVTAFKRDHGPDALELLMEAAMMNLMMAAGTDTGAHLVTDMANKVSALCGRARPGTVVLAVAD
jgi:hypothetical protein